MEIELIEGCMGDTFTADGKALMDMSDKEIKDIWYSLTKHIFFQELTTATRCRLVSIMMCIVEDFAEEQTTSDEPCEQCGDWIETFKMNI